MRTFLATLLLALMTSPAMAQQYKQTYRLTWDIGTPTEQGPLAAQRPEVTPFASEHDCNAFGERMSPRVRDWMRGFVRMDWDHPVAVHFRCEIAGQGA